MITKSMPKAVFLDVDGVLYDSMPLHAESWAEAFREFHVRIQRKLVYYAEGMKDDATARYMLQKLGKKLPTPVIKQIVREKVARFDAYPKPKMIRGAKEFINGMKKKGLRICLVTGSDQTKTIERIKRDFGIKKTSIITGKDVKKGKPHPEPYLAALRKFNITAKDAVVIENAPLGIMSAKRAGIKCIALKTGILARKELRKEGADFILNNFREAGASSFFYQ